MQGPKQAHTLGTLRRHGRYAAEVQNARLRYLPQMVLELLFWSISELRVLAIFGWPGPLVHIASPTPASSALLAKQACRCQAAGLGIWWPLVQHSLDGPVEILLAQFRSFTKGS